MSAPGAMHRDGISLKEFLGHTQQGIRAICTGYDLWDPDTTYQPQDWAALFFVMREVPDSPAFFPAGKWATLQCLEGKLTEWAYGRISEKERAMEASSHG